MRNADSILKRKFLAFFLVAMCALGTLFKEQSGIDDGPFLDGALIVCLVLGLWFWVDSKGMERRRRRDEEENRE